MKLKIDTRLCTKCSYCFIECPVKAVRLENDIYKIYENECIRCLICYDVCSFGAVIIGD